MNRSGYTEEYGIDDTWQLVRWRGAVNQAIKGKRGQTFLRELKGALEAMPKKELIAEELVTAQGEVCAVGCLLKSRGVNTSQIAVDDYEAIAKVSGVARALIQELEYINDDISASPELRYTWVKDWVEVHINSD